MTINELMYCELENLKQTYANKTPHQEKMLVKAHGTLACAQYAEGQKIIKRYEEGNRIFCEAMAAAETARTPLGALYAPHGDLEPLLRKR